MNARRFDALAVATTQRVARASRRGLVGGLAALAVAALTPANRVAQAFDGGLAPVQPPPSGLACASGADCAAGEICLNGACAPRQAVGGTAACPPCPETPGTTAVTPPTGGVGGLIQPGAPLPARIYAGRCGSLTANAAFQLIDISPIEGATETPQGALTAIPAEFSTTVVNTTIDDLLASDHAIDVRVDDTDPATSIACGDIGGPVESGPSGNELAVGLQQRGNSAYAGISWLQQETDRTIVRVFLARGLEESAPVTVAQPAATETPAAEAEATATPEAVTALAPIGPGSRVVTTIDVNLRAEPSDTAEVLTILGEGVELDVTGTPEGGWVPVTDPVSGQAGFVSDQFVTVAT